jgi:hypothetical protein
MTKKIQYLIPIDTVHLDVIFVLTVERQVARAEVPLPRALIHRTQLATVNC